MMPTQDRFPVVVIGAGLAGLSASVHLAEKGIAPLLLDADSRWAGGRLSGGDPETFVYQGQVWSFKPEHGVHALWGNYHNMRMMLTRFTDSTLQPSGGEEWINRWGREVRRIEAGNAIRSQWIPAPFHYLQLLFHPSIWQTIQPWDFLSLPGILASILLTLSVDPIKERVAWDGLTMDDFFYLWTPNLRTTFEGLGTNLIAAPKDQISLAGYIAALRFYTMLRRDAWQMSYLPADAHTSLIAPLTSAITARGGELRQGVEALCLERIADGWRVVVHDDNANGRRSIETDHVILATNAPAAQRLLCNSPDTRDEARTMIFPDGIGNATVDLWFSRAPADGAIGGMLTGDFTPDNYFWLHRLYDDYRAWHTATGGSAIELHFYDDRIIDQPDRNLIIEGVSEVLRAFPELKGSFVHGVVRRNSKVHTRFRVPTAASLHVESRWERLYACGDWVGYDTPALWMERATTTGIAAANAVLRAHDIDAYAVQQPAPPEAVARGLSAIMHAGRWTLAPLVRAITHARKARQPS